MIGNLDPERRNSVMLLTKKGKSEAFQADDTRNLTSQREKNVKMFSITT